MSRRARRREATATVVSLASVCAASVCCASVTTTTTTTSGARDGSGLVFWCGIATSVLAPLVDVAARRRKGLGRRGEEIVRDVDDGFRFRGVAASMVGYVVGFVAWCGICWAFGASGWMDADAARGARALASLASGMTFAPLFVACDAAMEDGREDAFEEMARQARRIVVDGDVRTPREVGARAAAFGACLGAWFGALPIPLDWDRPWQKWPVSVVRGMTFGHLVGATSAIVYVYLHDVLRMRATAAQTRGGEQTLTAAAEGEKEMFPSSPPKKRRGRPRKNPA